MPATTLSYTILPLGDSALVIDYGNRIDAEIHREVMARFRDIQQHPLPGMTDVLPAYSSLIIHYDATALRKYLPRGETAFHYLSMIAAQRLQQPPQAFPVSERLVTIPVCYDLSVAPDLAALAAAKNRTVEEVIALHTSVIYKVYMLGFMPGFPYMGIVDDSIAMPRKQHPVTVPAGSVGIAGWQTGIYPFTSPGGWQIIGRTDPGPLFRKQHTETGGLTLLQPGDQVQFYAVSKEELDACINAG